MAWEGEAAKSESIVTFSRENKPVQQAPGLVPGMDKPGRPQAPGLMTEVNLKSAVYTEQL
jgi:hypothetical protein